MDWSDEPATWKQVKFLKEHGCAPDRRLTKMEATELIQTFGGSPEPVTVAAEPAAEHLAPPVAYQLRVKADKARRNLQEAGRNQTERLANDWALALVERQAFWADTCRVSGRQTAVCLEVDQLYQKHGCRFEPPGRKEVQFILEALDTALPFWDRDNPELFYQTLELNFPALVRRVMG